MHRRMIAVLATALLGCGLAPAAASAKLKLGVTDIALQNRAPSQFWPDVTALNMGVIRSAVSWHDIAPTKPANPSDPDDPAYHWAALDRNVQDGAAWGGTVIYNVWGTPRWARRYKGRVFYVPVPRTNDFRAFLRALVKRYSGTFVPAGSPDGTAPLPRMRYFEIWNEPNNALGLAKPGGPRGNGLPAGPGAYVELLNAAYAVIHAADAKVVGGRAQVIGGAVGGKTGVNHVTFYKAMKRLHAKLDAISIHPYSVVFPKKGPKDGAPGFAYAAPYYRIGNFNRFVGFVRGWRGASFPIWITEIGWQVNPPERLIGVPSKTQALFFQQTVRKLRTFPQVKGMTWYLVRDEQTTTGWQSGLRTFKGTKRPIWSLWRDRYQH